MTEMTKIPDLNIIEERAVIWFMEELTTDQRIKLIRRIGKSAGEQDYAAQAAAFTAFLDDEYKNGRHDGAINEQRRIVAYLRKQADDLERAGSSFDHYDARALRREADAIETCEHLEREND